MLFTGFEDRGLILRGVLFDVSPPSECGILRSGPSGTLQLWYGERNQTPTQSTVSSFFFLLAAGLSLFLLLGLSACGGNFCIAEGGESWTSNLLMSSSKLVFFLPAAGPPLLKSPVLLELSSLNEPWFATQKLPPQAESPSSRNRDNPVTRRKKKDDTINDVGV